MKHQRRKISKQPKHLKPKGRKASAKSRQTHRPPGTTAELFARPREFQNLWNRVVQVPSEMRAQGLSLPQASRQLGVNTRTVLRLAGPAFSKRRGRYRVKPMDHLLRVLVVPSKKGLREIVTTDSREASLIGEYWSAVEKFLVRGDSSALEKLRRRTVLSANGKRVRFLFDLDELKRQGSAGVLRFESLYGKRA